MEEKPERYPSAPNLYCNASRSGTAGAAAGRAAAAAGITRAGHGSDQAGIILGKNGAGGNGSRRGLLTTRTDGRFIGLAERT